MKIDHLILGAYQTNCYIVRKSGTAKDCLIIDTGLEAGGLVRFLGDKKLNPQAVVFTHGHADHITGLAALRKSYPDIKVYIHKLDAELLKDPINNLSLLTGKMVDIYSADVLLEDGDIIEQAGIKLTVLYTPGHTSGGICLYSKEEGLVFVGDTLFAGSVGRTDLGGSMEQLIKSIRQRLLSLPDETNIYPGHGPISTIAQEKTSNPFLQ
ncbi:MAG: MBL fold metallo-hydrolase [Planctomycetota bacterium]|jgi:glyoxylase-like metal-dependent hydrolase (beta-lactamase superfamily II)